MIFFPFKYYFFLSLALYIYLFRKYFQRSILSKEISILFLNIIFLSYILNTISFVFYLLYIGLISLLILRKKGSFFGIIAFTLTILFFSRLAPFFLHNLSLNWSPQFSGNLGLLGFSFLALKVIGFLLQIKPEGYANYRPLRMMGYLSFAPTFIAGPIQNYFAYSREIDSIDAPLDLKRIEKNCWKILFGLVKLLFLAKWAYYNSFGASAFMSTYTGSPAEFLLGTYCYFLYIYFDFSGYCDIAIGVSNFFGFRIPENFLNPFFSKNIQEFWGRWHVTLSFWLRDFIFFPVFKFLRANYLITNTLLASSLAIFVSYSIMGLWYGFAEKYLLYSWYNCAGIIAYNWFRHKFPPLALPPKLITPCNFLSIGLTLHFFALGLLLALDKKDLSRIYQVSLAHFLTR